MCCIHLKIGQISQGFMEEFVEHQRTILLSLRREKKNVGVFPKNVGDFPKNVGDFPKNVGENLKKLRDFFVKIGENFIKTSTSSPCISR